MFDVVVRTCCKELATQTLSYMSAMCCTTATRPQYAMHHDNGRWCMTPAGLSVGRDRGVYVAVLPLVDLSYSSVMMAPMFTLCFV